MTKTSRFLHRSNIIFFQEIIFLKGDNLSEIFWDQDPLALIYQAPKNTQQQFE